MGMVKYSDPAARIRHLHGPLDFSNVSWKSIDDLKLYFITHTPNSLFYASWLVCFLEASKSFISFLYFWFFAWIFSFLASLLFPPPPTVSSMFTLRPLILV